MLFGSTITLSGVLKTVGGAPISGKTLTLSLGSGAGTQTCTGTTNASGSASCTVAVNQAVGAQPVSASFAGDANYLASSGSGSVSVFTAMSLSQSALAQATALLAGARHSDQDKLKDVIRELTAALAPSLWDADAIAAGGDRHAIADAQSQLAQAARDVARGRFDSAIGHYEKAWEDALDALKQHHH